MSKTRIFSVVGARPQFVKAAIVSQALAKNPDVEHCIVHTGQHYDQNMSDVFFQELGMPAPAFNLHIGGGGHGAMTGRQLEALEKLYLEEKPDVVVVYGDTNSTLAGALAAAKIHIPLAHVEAGLRSFNRMPEEINRVLTDHITDVHFSVTDVSTANLAREGITGDRVEQPGDVMYDCALQMAKVAEQKSKALETFGVEPGRFVLCTVHRAANTDDPKRLRVLMEGLDLLAQKLPGILPLHPRTRQHVDALGFKPKSANFKIVEPIGYIDIVRLALSSPTRAACSARPSSTRCRASPSATKPNGPSWSIPAGTPWPRWKTRKPLPSCAPRAWVPAAMPANTTATARRLRPRWSRCRR